MSAASDQATAELAELFDNLASRIRAGLIALIDQRIQLALAEQARQSLDLFRKGFDGLPEPADAPAGEVGGVGAGPGGGSVGFQSGQQVGQVTHDLASSRDGEGSVGAASAPGSTSSAETDAEVSA